MDVQGLFLGYFFLAPQKEVTRLPGRNPGAVPRMITVPGKTS